MTSLHDEYCTISFQHLDLNARQIMNARHTLHVYKKNVKTLVTPTLVVGMLNVEPKITEPFVSAFLDTLGTHTVFVKNVRQHFAL